MTDAPSSAAINTLGALLEARTGQQIAANRVWRVETALRPLLRARGLESLNQLVGLLITARDEDTATQVVDALLNHETSFFRDTAVIETIATAALDLAQAERRRLRIWSAGCSTGQEALSLAMLLNDRFAGTGLPEPEIVATDVSAAAVQRARTGRYSQFEIQRGMPVRQMMRWFSQHGDEWQAAPALMAKIRFARHNLVDEAGPGSRFDIVLCRNVLLYFSDAVRLRAFDRIAETMRPGGLLALGAGETVIGLTDGFKPCPRFRGLYRAVKPPACPRALRA